MSPPAAPPFSIGIIVTSNPPHKGVWRRGSVRSYDGGRGQGKGRSSACDYDEQGRGYNESSWCKNNRRDCLPSDGDERVQVSSSVAISRPTPSASGGSSLKRAARYML
eukprot:CAMPEP_0194316892 /NCGR_PEP_ID=MMETSP0171-20130528/13647_1 /TAXON_ID=218684 /ORGANISM="Corethron pennatum, Strain L29A3" /LENGTH=107 /DNA_ID=CAMNT_0039073285 /DNA_START=40 /DNA_END=359 /DNA_ORIENTATION=+